MFTFALTTALKNGWISGSNYSMAARARLAGGRQQDQRPGPAGPRLPRHRRGARRDLASQQQFYTSITLGSNDTHGQAPLLWAAHALLRTDCPGMR